MSDELTVGSSTTYEIGGKTVTLAPAALGKIKRALNGLTDSNVDVFDRLRNTVAELLANGKNDFATPEWIEENVTMPDATRIVSDARVINGLGENGFFGKGSTTQTRELEEGKPPTL